SRILLAAIRPRLDGGRTKAVGRDSGAVSGFGAVLVNVRAGRLVIEPFRGAQHQPQRSGLRISGELVSIRAASVRGAAGAAVRMAVVEAQAEGAVKPGEIFVRTAIRWAGVCGYGVGGIARKRRCASFPVL